MPILAAFPVVDQPEQIDTFAQFKDTRGFAFRSLSGDDLLPFTGSEFIARWGIQNLDVPARSVIEDAIPQQDGTDLREIKIGSRSYSIPLFVASDSSHIEYLHNRSRMRAFFNHRGVDYRANSGTFDLVAVSALGERSLRSTYLDGMNGAWDQETSGSYWETFGLQALAVNPYWDGGRWTSQAVRRADPGAGFFGHFPPRLSASNVLNADVLVTVQGDVESWPEIRATGPCTGLTVAGGDLMIEVPDGLVAGETMLIVTDPRNKQVLFDGGQDWSRLSPLSIQAPLQLGEQMLRITVPDPDAQTQVQISGVKWYETPW